jgi:hypothetical protein
MKTSTQMILMRIASVVLSHTKPQTDAGVLQFETISVRGRMEAVLALLRYLFVGTVTVGGAYIVFLLVRLAREKAAVVAPKEDV